MYETESYKFKGGQGMLERGDKGYGSKKSNTCNCPVCEGGSKLMLFQCKNCKGTGQVENAKKVVGIKCDNCGHVTPITNYDDECEKCHTDLTMAGIPVYSSKE